MAKTRTDLDGVQIQKRKLADGGIAVHYYHRASRTPLPGKPGSPEFKQALAAARAGVAAPRAQAGTLSTLIHAYTHSGEWKKLADSTREIKRLNLKAVEDKWGTVPLVVFNSNVIRPDVLAWRDEIAEKHPRAADAKIQAFASVLAWGRGRTLISDNPLAGIKNLYESHRADRIWLPQHIKAMEAVCGPQLHLALMLALHTGQRQGDIRQLDWSAYDGRAITLIQGKSKKGGKGGRTVYIPCTTALRMSLDAVPVSTRRPTIVTDSRGNLWEKRAFSRAWDKAYEAAELPQGDDQLNFHDLRGTAVTMLSEAGCTPQEIATITGHTLVSVNRILEVYLSRTRALAESAILKLEAYRSAAAA